MGNDTYFHPSSLIVESYASRLEKLVNVAKDQPRSMCGSNGHTTPFR